ncbi:nucleoside-diphosphate kinase [Haloarcula sp. AONF1]
MAGDAPLVLLKPDARKHNVVSGALHRIEEEVPISTQSEQSNRPRPAWLTTTRDFYPSLVEYMLENPGVVAVEITGEDAVQRMRYPAWETEPASTEEGTIRGDLSSESYEQADEENQALRNLVHASEPGESHHELRLWFSDGT